MINLSPAASIHLLRLALPLTLAQLAFAANTFVTNWFLAHASATALHAALPGSMLAVAFSALVISTLGYAGTLFARHHGNGDAPRALATFRAAVGLTIGTAPLFVLAAPIGHRILAVFNTTPDVLAAESDYFDVLLANGFFTALAAVLGGYFTGQGRTRLVGGVTIFGFFVNMALAPLFINGTCGLPVRGITGAGWAATIAHVVPCLILTAAIILKPLGARSAPVTRAILDEVLRLGAPNGVRSLIDIGGFFVFVALLAECAPAAAAASTAAFAVNGVFQAFPQGLAAALEILRARREHHALASAVLLSCVSALAFALVLLLAGEHLLVHFRKTNAPFSLDEFLATARPLLLILGVKALFESLVMVLQAALRGTGRTATVFRVQFCSSLLFWTPLYLAVRAFCPTIPVYWLTMVACSAFSALLLARALRTQKA